MSQFTRTEVEYTNKEKAIIAKNIKTLNQQIDKLYDNQIYTANNIVSYFKDDNVISVSVYGRTQCGKTGCMISTIQQFTSNNLIPIENIYIITGLSDKQWKADTIHRFPDILKSQILHRPNLNDKFINKIKKQQNVFIIMDEIQIASKNNQTINKIFTECGFYDLEYLCDNDIKIVQFSATPDGNIIDLKKWNEHSKSLYLQTGRGYTGTLDFLIQNRLFKYKSLEVIENVNELKIPILGYKKPMYHLIRVPCKKKGKQEQVISNFTKIFKNDNIIFNTNFLETDKKDINTVLKIAPTQHTIIFYCEILRCAKTQHKTYIGISYERYNYKPNDSSIIQGAVGRLTGYDDNGISICYTNIGSINNYEKLLDNNMSYTDVVWNTNTTRYVKKENKSISKGTFNSTNNIEQFETIEESNEPIIKEFDTQDKMIKWFKKHLPKETYGRGPNKKKIDEDGFYRSAGATRKGKHIISTETVYKERRSGLNDKNKFRSYPCYSDITNPETLEWWLIYNKL